MGLLAATRHALASAFKGFSFGTLGFEERGLTSRVLAEFLLGNVSIIQGLRGSKLELAGPLTAVNLDDRRLGIVIQPCTTRNLDTGESKISSRLEVFLRANEVSEVAHREGLIVIRTDFHETWKFFRPLQRKH